MAADREDGDGWRPSVLHQRHVAEEVGVAGVVHARAVLEFEEPAPAADLPRGLGRPSGHGHAARVLGVHHGEADAGRLESAALVHPYRLDPTTRQVDAHLVGADDRGAAATRQLDDVNRIVADVVEVAMRRGDDINLPGHGRRDVGWRATPSVHPEPLVARGAIQDPAVAEAGDAQLRHGASCFLQTEC